jgi:hypothetical protein
MKSIDILSIQVECRDDESKLELVRRHNSPASSAPDLGKARFEPGMFELSLLINSTYVDTAFVLPASVAVWFCRRILGAIHLCTIAVLRVLRPKFLVRGAAMIKKPIDK